MSEPPYVMTRRPSRKGVIHRNPAWESCNTDQAQHKTPCDLIRAVTFVTHGEARWCCRCFPKGSPA